MKGSVHNSGKSWYARALRNPQATSPIPVLDGLKSRLSMLIESVGEVRRNHSSVQAKRRHCRFGGPACPKGGSRRALVLHQKSWLPFLRSRASFPAGAMIKCGTIANILVPPTGSATPKDRMCSFGWFPDFGPSKLRPGRLLIFYPLLTVIRKL